jgi:hypothetical protein
MNEHISIPTVRRTAIVAMEWGGMGAIVIFILHDIGVLPASFPAGWAFFAALVITGLGTIVGLATEPVHWNGEWS